MLVATPADRLGIEALAGEVVRLRGDRPGAADAGRKVMALVFAMVLGATASMTATCSERAARAVCWRAGAGLVDVGDVLARVYLRARPSARRAPGPRLDLRVAGRGRPGRPAAGDRHRLLRRRGLRNPRSRAPATATRAPSATTRSWRPVTGGTSGLITNRTDQLAVVEAEHREHAVVEQVIADLKDQPSPTSHQATSTPAAPGLSWPPSRTTCSAGPNRSASQTRPSAPPAPSVDACSASPVA